MRSRFFLLACAGAALVASEVQSQCRDATAPAGSARFAPLPMLGGPLDDYLRLLQDLGRCSTGSQLIRSTSALSEPLSGTGQVRFAALAPRLESTWNSKLPFSLNDGPQWAGRGLTSTITVGARAEAGRVSITIAPQVVYEQNRDFFVFRSGDSTRSDYASPWHFSGESLDLPLRFGNRPVRGILLGQSRLEVKLGQVGVGASTESLWWGPGIANALVMSDNAAGIPQIYVRTANPIATPIGTVEARGLIGGLSESMYFDHNGANNTRSLNAVVATLRLAADTGLTLGVARSVYAAVTSNISVLGHVADVFLRWDQRSDTIVIHPDRPTDQIMSLFGRWVFPQYGVEIYGEWAKLFPPLGFRELVIQPQRGQGYTLGLQWVRPLARATLFRLQTEATMLEQTPPERDVPVRSFYSSALIPQGYTQRGQSIGAAIGPGSSSQWLAGDYIVGTRRIGVMLGRIRWEDEAYYHQPSSIGFYSHDVSMLAGIRGGAERWGLRVDAELIHQIRLNYLFQSSTNGYLPDPTFDIRNNTFRLSVTPLAVRR